MPLPEHLSAVHLRAGVVDLLPDATEDDHQPAVAAALDRAIGRIDLRAAVAAAWLDRLPRLPVPPRPPRTLQESVQVARARLRQDRVDADVVELGNRRFVLDHIRKALP
jgi:hypothetical protein